MRLAASFLTILPVGGDEAAAADVARSFAWFPLIGFAIGGALSLEDWLLAFLFTRVVRSALIVLTLEAISGAVHLDGLADTTDALGAGRDRMRALEIMRDSRIGTFGAATIFFVLVLKIAAIGFTGGGRRRLALYIAPGLARWAMVAVPYKFSYLREHGAGSALIGERDTPNLRGATIIVLAALIAVPGWIVLRALIVAAAMILIIRVFYKAWLGGVTGDMIGAAGELVEAAIMIAIAG
ncbi:MAG TPA: adenosylcobinamide-GDP ribazoletransferase [Candidatus Binataceae bacterium]|nr:adenosylcobinamide-GDP ribazoletransferase [Candidatus Binataceae bacterium]